MAETRYDFTGTTAVVTGAAGGIGAALAGGLAAAGSRVWLVDRDPAVRRRAAKLAGHAVVGDLREAELPARVVTAVGAPVDVLVLAAGMQHRTAGLDIAEPDWRALCDVNLGATYRMIRAVVPAMARRGRGSVLAVSSMSADRAMAGIVPYGATKAAVSQLVRGLAVELGDRGVRLNAIAPGYVRTPMTEALLADGPTAARIADRVPLGHIAEPEDMVGPGLFLLSDAARYITGQVLAVDGGYALS